jgi:hypothetical protein
MIVQARHCKHCQEVFLPVSGQPWSFVQCPHCSGQMAVTECATAEVAQVMPEQEYHRITEEEVMQRRQARRNEWWTRRLAWACGTGAVLIASLGIWQYWRGGSQKAKKRIEQVAVLTESEKVLQQDQKDIEATIRRVLGAKSLEELLPDVAGGGQVKDLMAWYFNRSHPLKPEVLNRIESTDILDSGGREIRRVGLSTVERPGVWMVLSRENGAWKLNWEIYTMGHVERWRAFLREQPGASLELPLLAVKKPAPDSFIVKAGASRDTHDAIHLSANDRNDLAGAVLLRDSPVWKMLPGISFEEAVKIIARVTLLDPQSDPPLVRLDEVIQTGWVRGTQKPVAAKVPRR